MQSGQNLQHIGQFVVNGSIKSASEAAGVVAHAGGGQALATLLADGCNEITTVASGNDSVKLPPAVGGMVVFVANQSGANSAQVFGSGIDTINAVATGTGVALANGKNAVFFCTKTANAGNSVTAATAGEWYMVLSA